MVPNGNLKSLQAPEGLTMGPEVVGMILGWFLEHSCFSTVTWCHSSVTPTAITLTFHILENYLI